MKQKDKGRTKIKNTYFEAEIDRFLNGRTHLYTSVTGNVQLLLYWKEQITAMSSPRFFVTLVLAFTLPVLTGCRNVHPQTIFPTEDTSTVVARHGNLRVSGPMIVDQLNNPVQLYGMSLFWSQWMGKYYTAETISTLARDWKCSVVRAAMGVESGGYLQNPQREKEKVFQVIDAAIQEGIYVIVDWHDHHAEDHVEQAKFFFEEVSLKYGKYPNIIYEVYNEPLDVSWSKVIKPYCESVIETIRKNDPDNIIACGTRQWSQRVDEAALDPIQRDNIVYVLHFYASTHKENLRQIARSAIEKGLPLIVTEFGTTEASGDGVVDEQETKKWWAFLDQYKISWCNWSVADKKESSAALKPGNQKAKWTTEMLNPSGKIVRDEIRARAGK